MMKLYVIKNKERVYINKIALTRSELERVIGKKWFVVDGGRYSVRDVCADGGDDNDIYISFIVGGLIGMILGPVGIFVGFIVGYIFGVCKYLNVKNDVVKFNKS